MSRCLALLALALCLVGCTRYNSRAQGPFKRPPPAAPNPALVQNAVPPPRSPLVINTPTAPLPAAGTPDEPRLVPPPPPGPGGVAVAPPQPPRPPAVPDPNVAPAAALVPDAPGPDADPNADRRRREPNPAALPSPYAPPTNPPAPSPGAGAPGSGGPGSPANPAPPQNTNLGQVKKLAEVATEKWKTVTTYEARLTRREASGSSDGPTEEVLFQFRKEPMSVYMENVGPTGKGRRVLYNPKQFGDTLHILTGAGDTGGAGQSRTISPDNVLVKARSRHSIRDAGFGTTVGKFADLVAKIEAGRLPPDTLKYAGTVTRPEFGDLPLAAVEQTVRPGEDPHLKAGGLRQWYFDARPDSPGYGLPVLVILSEANGRPGGREVEYYCFAQVRLPANLGDADFHPNRVKK